MFKEDGNVTGKWLTSPVRLTCEREEKDGMWRSEDMAFKAPGRDSLAGMATFGLIGLSMVVWEIASIIDGYGLNQ
jgi:hypothetical protein